MCQISTYTSCRPWPCFILGICGQLVDASAAAFVVPLSRSLLGPSNLYKVGQQEMRLGTTKITMDHPEGRCAARGVLLHHKYNYPTLSSPGYHLDVYLQVQCCQVMFHGSYHDTSNRKRVPRGCTWRLLPKQFQSRLVQKHSRAQKRGKDPAANSSGPRAGLLSIRLRAA